MVFSALLSMFLDYFSANTTRVAGYPNRGHGQTYCAEPLTTELFHVERQLLIREHWICGTFHERMNRWSNILVLVRLPKCCQVLIRTTEQFVQRIHDLISVFQWNEIFLLVCCSDETESSCSNAKWFTAVRVSHICAVFGGLGGMVLGGQRTYIKCERNILNNQVHPMKFESSGISERKCI